MSTIARCIIAAGLLGPGSALAQTADYRVVAVEQEGVIAVSANSIRDTPEGFRAFRVAAWEAEPSVTVYQGEDVTYRITTGEVLADCGSKRFRPISAAYFNDNLSEVAREVFDEPFDGPEDSPMVTAVCSGAAGDFSADTWLYPNLASFAAAAPGYRSRAAVTAPQVYINSYRSTLTQEQCYQRAKEATLQMSSDQGGEIWERRGWYAYFGPVTLTILCTTPQSVVITAAKSNYSLGDLAGIAGRAASLMGVQD